MVVICRKERNVKYDGDFEGTFCAQIGMEIPFIFLSSGSHTLGPV